MMDNKNNENRSLNISTVNFGSVCAAERRRISRAYCTRGGTSYMLHTDIYTRTQIDTHTDTHGHARAYIITHGSCIVRGGTQSRKYCVITAVMTGLAYNADCI